MKLNSNTRIDYYLRMMSFFFSVLCVCGYLLANLFIAFLTFYYFALSLFIRGTTIRETWTVTVSLTYCFYFVSVYIFSSKCVLFPHISPFA